MSKEFEDLLGQYWDLAHLEGKSGVSQGDKANEVLHALKKLAEQPAQPQQEPVYFCDYGYEGWGKVDADMAAANLADGMTVEAYYTSPPAQRKPLTDEEIESINVRLAGNRDLARLFARAIEAAHGIKGDA